MPARMLSVLLRNKLRAAVRRADLYDDLPERARNAFDTPWVVHAQHAAHGHEALDYIGRYLHRGPFGNHQLEHVDAAPGHERVRFRFQSHRTGKTERLTLPAHAFLARLLQHVLPKGTHRVHGYGLYSSRMHQERDRAAARLEQHAAATATAQRNTTSDPEPQGRVAANKDERRKLTCPHCGRGRLRVIAHFDRRGHLYHPAWRRCREPP